MQKQYQREEDTTSVEERRWTIIGARWNNLYERKDIYSKQQETQRKDTMGKL